MRLFLMCKGGAVGSAVSAVEPEQGSPPSEEIPPRHRPAAPHSQRYSGKPSLRQNFSNSHLCGFDLGFGSGLTNKLYRHQSKTSSSKKRPVKGLYTCIRVYRILSHTRKGARGEQLNQRRDEVIHPSLKFFFLSAWCDQ